MASPALLYGCEIPNFVEPIKTETIWGGGEEGRRRYFGSKR
jgi:hypothetical protein